MRTEDQLKAYADFLKSSEEFNTRCDLYILLKDWVKGLDHKYDEHYTGCVKAGKDVTPYEDWIPLAGPIGLVHRVRNYILLYGESLVNDVQMTLLQIAPGYDIEADISSFDPEYLKNKWGETHYDSDYRKTLLGMVPVGVSHKRNDIKIRLRVQREFLPS